MNAKSDFIATGTKLLSLFADMLQESQSSKILTDVKGNPPIPWTIGRVAKEVGNDPKTIRKRIKQGTFPKPSRKFDTGSEIVDAWIPDQVEEWLDGRRNW